MRGFLFLAVTLIVSGVASAKCPALVLSPLKILEQSKTGIRRAQNLFPLAMSDARTRERWEWLNRKHGYRIRLMGPSAQKDLSYTESVLAWSDHDEGVVEFNPVNTDDFNQAHMADLTFMHEVSDSVFFHRAYRWRNGWVLTDRMETFLEGVKSRHPGLAEIAGIAEKELDAALLMYFRERESFLYVTRFVRRAIPWRVHFSEEIEEVQWAVLAPRALKKAVIEHLENEYNLPAALSGRLWTEALPHDLAW